MKLSEILNETFKNRYEKGDRVSTALGNGVITHTQDPTEKEQSGHIMVHHDEDARKKHKLEDRPYKMTSGQIHKHI